jgi:MurNAc alpha-1-phosphate uridylyltransferase
MKALVLAAGRGERMRPLTDTVPKPLLVAGGKPLIAWHLERLAALGIDEVVVNTAHLAAQFPIALGDGARYGVRIRYSHEGDVPLETGGALLHAAELLGGEPFLLVNGDVWSDFDFARLPATPRGLAHLVMVEPPDHSAAGDFRLAADGLLHAEGEPRLTYAGIGMYRPQLLTGWRGIIGHAPGAREQPPRFPLAPLLRAAMRSGQVTGEHHTGRWTDVGTPDRLAALDQSLR